jgi:hypothetical protein
MGDDDPVLHLGMKYLNNPPQFHLRFNDAQKDGAV